MSAFADVFRVLVDPAPVFERVREKPRFLIPYLVLAVAQIIIGVVNLPYLTAGMKATLATRQVPAGGPDPATLAMINIFAVPIVVVLFFLLSTLILWVLVAIMGGDGKFGTLLSVTAYAAVPSVLLLAIIGSVVLRLKGLEAIASQADLQPALGLDLLVPSAEGFVGGVLRAVNPFTIWGLVLTAIGVSITHNLSRSTGYTIATISFVIGVLLAGLLTGLGS